MMERFSTSSFVSGLIVGALLAGAWFLRDTFDTAAFISSSPAPATTESSVPESGAISVKNQPAGSSVVVESITVPPPGVWAAVREMNGNNLGNVLGAARVVGPHSAVEIPLLRATEADRTYAVELYRDDNENGSFDPSVNSVYVDFDTGLRVVAYFTTAP